MPWMRCASAAQSNHEIVKGESRNRQKGSRNLYFLHAFPLAANSSRTRGNRRRRATLGGSRMAAAEHRLRTAAPPQAAQPSSGGMAAHNRRLLDVWRFVRSDHLTPLPAVPAPVGKTSVPANVAAAARVYLDAHWQDGELVLVDAAGSKLKGGTLRGVSSYMGTCQEHNGKAQRLLTILVGTPKDVHNCDLYFHGFSAMKCQALDVARTWCVSRRSRLRRSCHAPNLSPPLTEPFVSIHTSGSRSPRCCGCSSFSKGQAAKVPPTSTTTPTGSPATSIARRHASSFRAPSSWTRALRTSSCRRAMSLMCISGVRMYVV